MTLRRPSPSGIVLMSSALALPLSPARAQQQAPADEWRAQIEFGLNGATGNSSFAILRTGGSITRLETDRYEFEISTLLRYGKNDEKVIADDLRGTVKFDWKPESTFSPFVFATASRDEIRKLDTKVNSGAGAKWTFFQGDGSDASFSLAALLDYENFALPAGSTEAESSSLARLSVRVRFEHTFAGGAEVSHVTFWQPVVDDFADYVVEVENSLSTRLLANLSLVIQHEYLHDEIPPPGVVRDDQKFSVVLRVAL